MTTDLATSPSPEPQDVRERPDSPRALARVIQPWLRSVCSNSDSERLARDIGEEVSQHLRKAPALAQSDAEPVAQYSCMCGIGDRPCPGPDGRPLCDTAPPRPDASGLIEAAKIEEIAIKCARHELNLWENSTENLDDAVARACATAARQVLRARAADRSGK